MFTAQTGGKGNMRVWSASDLSKYRVIGDVVPSAAYRYRGYILERDFVSRGELVAAFIPLVELVSKSSKSTLSDIGLVTCGSVRQSKTAIITKIGSHVCSNCPAYVCMFQAEKSPEPAKQRMAAMRKR